MNEATIRLHVEPLDNGQYLATSPDVPGLLAQGRTIAETVEIAQDVARKIAESCLAHGLPMPAALIDLGEEVPVDLLIPVSVPAS
jgi:antitoxin HicB